MSFFAYAIPIAINEYRHCLWNDFVTFPNIRAFTYTFPCNFSKRGDKLEIYGTGGTMLQNTKNLLRVSTLLMQQNFWCFSFSVASWPLLSRADRSSTRSFWRWIGNNKVSLNQFLNSWGHSWGGSLPFKSYNTGLWAEFKLTDPWLPEFQTLKIVNLCRFPHPLLVFRIIIPDSCEILVFRKSLRLFPNLRQLAISPQNLSEKLLENICEYFSWTEHDLKLSFLFLKTFLWLSLSSILLTFGCSAKVVYPSWGILRSAAMPTLLRANQLVWTPGQLSTIFWILIGPFKPKKLLLHKRL